MAFQLSDDLLDITSPSGESGKTPGTDLREGIRTLPVLLAEEDGLMLPDDLSDDAVLAATLDALRASAAIDRARRAELVTEAAGARETTRRAARRPRPGRPGGPLRLRGHPDRLRPESHHLQAVAT